MTLVSVMSKNVWKSHKINTTSIFKTKGINCRQYFITVVANEQQLLPKPFSHHED